MFRPRGFAELSGRRVGVWGVGVEGAATARRLAEVQATAVLVDDVGDPDHGVLATDRGGYDELARCDVVLKSPGIPRRRDDVTALADAGVWVTSALNLWLLETARDRVVAITGTKGKSTTTALIAFLFGAMGEHARAAGNIGLPPYDPAAPAAAWTALEVSSFQAVEVEAAPAVVVVTSLGADHLDWHGSLDEYFADKLSLTRAGGDHATLLADDPTLLNERHQIGGRVHVVAAMDSELAGQLRLLGRHNASNVALAVAAVATALGAEERTVAEAAIAHADSFEPLPGRLTVVRERGGVRFIDDGLATSPLPTTAALAVFGDEHVALIVGGFDRGVDYQPLCDVIAARTAPTTVVAMGGVGDRIAADLVNSPTVRLLRAHTVAEAVTAAASVTHRGDVVLFSPAAPSFDHYTNWAERSADFAASVRAL